MNPTAKKTVFAYIKIVAIFLMPLVALGLFVKLSLWLWPFACALVIAVVIEPLIRLIRKTRVKRSIASLIALLASILVLAALVIFIIIRIYVFVVGLAVQLPGVLSDLSRQLSSFLDSSLGQADPQASEFLQRAASSAISSLGSLITPIGYSMISMARGLPQMILATIITLLSAFLFSKDREKIGPLIEKHFSRGLRVRLASIKNDLFRALGAYIRTQLIMMLITFSELSAGFLIIGYNYVSILPVILLISVVDALPVFGAGLFLLPWAAYGFFTGNFWLGFSILALYLCLLIVRQLVEPRVLSQQIRIHPLLTLLAVYAGLMLFGIIGLVLGPIILVTYRNLIPHLLHGKTLKEFIEEQKAA